MNAATALARLRALRVPAVTTADAAAVLRVSIPAASAMLRRLARTGVLTSFRRGVFLPAGGGDPLALGEYVTAPYPAYVSLQTALYRHGMIEQIPSLIYLVSLGRTQRVKTSLGTYSVHHALPEVFDGYELKSGIKLASPEKALVDFLYLSPAKSRLFAALPELSLPRGFRKSAARVWAARIREPRRRRMVQRKLEEAFAAAVKA